MFNLVGDYARDLRREFSGYNAKFFQADLFAGVTVAAVALPLALAFGVGSGADAASGLISAIVSAFLIGALSGASFQISGPTGAMTAILIPLSARYGMQGVLAAGAIAGGILLLAGLLRLGKLVYFLPAPVISGFTSGIAVIIALGQAENLFGVKSHGTETLERFWAIFSDGFAPNYFALAIGVAVIAIMFLWPKKFAARFPGSLAAVLISTVVAFVFRMPVDLVGEIPRTLVHESRLTIDALLSVHLSDILVPAFSVAALGMIESLLCGVAGGKMKGERLNGDRELIAQGIGNLLLPFLGGVPATAAIARSSVAIKSGGRTRLTGIVQGVVLLLSMFLLAPLMSRIPLSALAGVLMVTAWRMNDWHNIRYIFGRNFKFGVAKFLITMIVTIVFDLTIAIAAGATFAMIAFVSKVAELDVKINDVDPARVGGRIKLAGRTQLIYVTGAIFFGSIDRLESGLSKADGDIVIVSMRAVPYIDTSGVQSLHEYCERMHAQGRSAIFASVNPKVMPMLQRAGIVDLLGHDAFFDTIVDAIGMAELPEA
ncbi:SulP family inorganic anion transporter [Synergistaceae bacterium OttesenSCG-928-I11]|nr:SulP family inorganic anion transporter [Synergistaceae bacterium OttesenSCG-928-I11]